MTWLINNEGNAHDVLCTLQTSYKGITIADIEASIADEKAHRNRFTHIVNLKRALKYKQKGQTYFGRSKKS